MSWRIGGYEFRNSSISKREGTNFFFNIEEKLRELSDLVREGAIRITGTLRRRDR